MWFWGNFLAHIRILKSLVIFYFRYISTLSFSLSFSLSLFLSVSLLLSLYLYLSFSLSPCLFFFLSLCFSLSLSFSLSLFIIIIPKVIILSLNGWYLKNPFKFNIYSLVNFSFRITLGIGLLYFGHINVAFFLIIARWNSITLFGIICLNIKKVPNVQNKGNLDSIIKTKTSIIDL